MALETDFISHLEEMQAPLSEEFALYCEAELEKRLNSGENLDIAGYREVMEMVMTKLKALESEEIT